jgi:hypothetical protein
MARTIVSCLPEETPMKSLFRLLVLPFALAVLLPAGAAAQVKIAPGSYEMVPDSNYTAGFDVTGIVIEFTETTMTALQMGNVLVKSSLSFAGDVLTLTDTEGSVACPSASTYKVSVTPKGVRMTPVQEACAERGAVLGQVTLVKKG